MIRKLIQRTKLIREFERQLARHTPLIDGRETRKVSRAIQFEADKFHRLADGEVPFDRSRRVKERLRLSDGRPVRLGRSIWPDGHITVRAVDDAKEVDRGRHFRVDCANSTIQAAYSKLNGVLVDVEYDAVDYDYRKTYYSRALQWARAQ